MTVEQAALGIHRVVNANMAEGMRFVSVKRGIDPRRLSALVPLGGAGPVHATALARELGMRRVVVPRIPACCRPRDCSPRRSSTRRRRRSTPSLERSDEGTSGSRTSPRSTARCGELMASEGVALPAVIDRAISPMSATSASPITWRCAVDMQGDPVAGHPRRFLRGARPHLRSRAPGPIQLVNLRAVHQAPVRVREGPGGGPGRERSAGESAPADPDEASGGLRGGARLRALRMRPGSVDRRARPSSSRRTRRPWSSPAGASSRHPWQPGRHPGAEAQDERR